MRYQIAYKPRNPTGIWFLRAHGATHSETEAQEAKERLEKNSYDVVLLPLEFSK